MDTLAEDYFQEKFGFDKAKEVGRDLAAKRSFKKMDNRLLKIIGKDKKNFPKKSHIDQQKYVSKKYETDPKLGKLVDDFPDAMDRGGKAGQVALGAAYAGGAYLAYKGIKKLIQKLKNEKDPEKRAELKKKISVQKQKIKK